MSNNSKNSNMSMIAILALFMMISAASFGTAGLANIGQAFPDVPSSTISYCTTLVSLFSMISATISGNIVGKKVKFKTLILISSIVLVFAGVIPIAFDNFVMILISRALFGFALGFISPLGAALISRLYPAEKQAGLNGYGLTAQYFGSFAFVYIGSLLVVKGLDYMWLSHLVLLIPAVLALIFLREPEQKDADEPAEEKVQEEKVKLPFGIYVRIIGYTLLFICPFIVCLNITSIVLNENIGSAAVSATVLNAFTIGGIIGGAIFGTLNKIFKRFTTPLLIVIDVVGLFLCATGKSAIVLGLGSALAGMGFATMSPAGVVELTSCCDKKILTKAIGLFYSAYNLAVFLSSPYLQIVGAVSGNQDPRFVHLVSTVFYAVLFVIWVLAKIKKPAEVVVQE